MPVFLLLKYCCVHLNVSPSGSTKRARLHHWHPHPARQGDAEGAGLRLPDADGSRVCAVRAEARQGEAAASTSHSALVALQFHISIARACRMQAVFKKRWALRVVPCGKRTKRSVSKETRSSGIDSSSTGGGGQSDSDGDASPKRKREADSSSPRKKAKPIAINASNAMKRIKLKVIIIDVVSMYCVLYD